MYSYVPPDPLIINLNNQEGFEIRTQAAEYLQKARNVKGAERGTEAQQGYGLVAEMFVRKSLGLPALNPQDHPVDYDLLLPSGVKVDVKCRGGRLAFSKEYTGADGLSREAKHNLFARQVFDPTLDADIYLFTHFRTTSDGELPGSRRDRSWFLYVCGWISKRRAAREGVYLPPGALTEQGSRWFTYRFHEVEIYNKNLNGLQEISRLASIGLDDVERDAQKQGDLNMTTVDAARICYDLAGRGVLRREALESILSSLGAAPPVQPMFHPNQYEHLARWLLAKDLISAKDYEGVKNVLPPTPFSGL